MEFDGFEWDSGNRDKCQKHGVSPSEIESLFAGEPLVGPDPYHTEAERRFRAAGKTAVGRALFVFFTWRRRGEERLIRPISARYTHQKESNAYEQKVSRV